MSSFFIDGQAVALFSSHALRYKRHHGRSGLVQVREDMWLFTRWGFFNVASARQGDGSHDNEIDSHSLVIGAVESDHLEALKAHLPDLIGNCFLKEVAESAFKAQMIVDKNIWSQVMLSLSQELNYDDFREEIVKTHSMDDPSYLKTITDIEEFISKIRSTGTTD